MLNIDWLTTPMEYKHCFTGFNDAIKTKRSQTFL